MVKLNSKTLFTVVGVVCLFCIRLCTQTSEAKSRAVAPPSQGPVKCHCSGCRPDIHGPCSCPPCEAHYPPLTNTVPACLLLDL